MSETNRPTEEALRAALATVNDPELGVDIVSLGLVERLEVADDGAVAVVIRPTSPSCPVGDLLVEQSRTALVRIEGVGPVHVTLDRGQAQPSERQSRLGVAIRDAGPAPAPAASSSPALARAPFLLLGLAALVVGAWGGMARTGGNFPLPSPGWLIGHGPLMIGGFLGTVITLERAVGVGWRLAWAAPLLSAIGALLLILPVDSGAAAPAVMTAASAALVAIYVALIARGAKAATMVEASGAVAWLGGNLAWLGGAPLFAVLPWWLAFPVLTIVGERIELATVRRPLTAAALLVPTGVLLAYTAALAALMFPTAWPPLMGAALLTLASWLFAGDVARETVRVPGLPRFTAWCLLTGYAWMAFGGLLMILGEVPAAGLYYDAVVHTVLVGFVIAMIFGHAPIIFPAVLRRPIPFTRLFYVHLILLEVAMILRVYGALADKAALRTAGAHATATTLVVFLILTAAQVLRGRRSA